MIWYWYDEHKREVQLLGNSFLSNLVFMSNLKIALNGRHLFLSMLIVIFFTFTSLSSIFWFASTSSRASSAALQTFYFQQTVQSVPDLLAEKVFTLLQLLALLKQPFGKIAQKKYVKLTSSGQNQHRPHWQVCGSFAQVESESPGILLFLLAFPSKANLHRS